YAPQEADPEVPCLLPYDGAFLSITMASSTKISTLPGPVHFTTAIINTTLTIPVTQKVKMQPNIKALISRDMDSMSSLVNGWLITLPPLSCIFPMLGRAAN
ncbi:hypothetical protein, partial [Brucella sp. 191011898]|uniref:hypothetical protein n=1 Tax=Brucella sp. 191011898 TaxID=2730447 RepID=UPI001AED3C99